MEFPVLVNTNSPRKAEDIKFSANTLRESERSGLKFQWRKKSRKVKHQQEQHSSGVDLCAQCSVQLLPSSPLPASHPLVRGSRNNFQVVDQAALPLNIGLFGFWGCLTFFPLDPSFFFRLVIRTRWECNKISLSKGEALDN